MKQNIIIFLLIIILIGVFYHYTVKNNKEFPNSPKPTYHAPIKHKNPFFDLDTPTPLHKSVPTSKMRTFKGMTCTLVGNTGSMDCQQYESTYDANATPLPVPSGLILENP